LDIQKNINLKEWNSWKVGGKADFFCQPKNEQEVFNYLKWANKNKIPVTVLSGGTNVLISDQGVEGLVIHLKNLNKYQVEETNNRLCIKALAGVSKSEIMQCFLKYKLAPALFLCGLPGDVGGGVVMNAGIGKNISPKEFKDIVDWVKVIHDNQITNIKSKNINWAYRSSDSWGPGVIYEVGMSWPMEPTPDIDVLLRDMALKRSQSQPLRSASCGSVFKNPLNSNEKSGALIEKCGLKGYQIGQAFVSKKHANFIVNQGGAKAVDIHHLIQFIKKTVFDKFNILLETEVKYIGRLEGFNI